MAIALENSKGRPKEDVYAAIKHNLKTGNDVIVENFEPETQSQEFGELAKDYQFHFLIDGAGKNCKFQKDISN